jgi:Xaa-Pro aminopeptidase
MQTVQPALKRGRDVWDPIHLPQKAFEERLVQIKDEMQKEGIDVLFLYGNGVNEYGHPSYISNVIIKVPRGALVVIPKKGAPTLIVEGFPRDLPEVKSTTWMSDVRSCGDISQECLKLIQERGLLSSTLGFIGVKPLMPYDKYRFLMGALKGCQILDAEHILRKCRSVKSERESDQIRRASRIVRNSFSSLAHIPFSSLTENGLEAILDCNARLEGAEDIRILLGRPQDDTWTLRPAESITLSEGAGLIIYIAVAFERYWSEGIRTFRCEKSSLVEHSNREITTVFDEILHLMRPGKSVADFYKEALNETKKASLDTIATYGLGHGIGLSLQEFPNLEEGVTDDLKNGMCFAIRMGAKDKELGSAMIGETIILSDDHQSVLT